jgi:hypothetical protein
LKRLGQLVRVCSISPRVSKDTFYEMATAHGKILAPDALRMSNTTGQAAVYRLATAMERREFEAMEAAHSKKPLGPSRKERKERKEHRVALTIGKAPTHGIYFRTTRADVPDGIAFFPTWCATRSYYKHRFVVCGVNADGSLSVASRWVPSRQFVYSHAV